MSSAFACPGFRFAGLAAGIKSNGRHDLGLVLADGDVPAAAVFTRNQLRAAPVTLSAAHLAAGVARAIIVNSGNANACTGAQGDADAAAMAYACARAIGCPSERVLVASTGVIGRPLPIERIVSQAGALYGAARADGLEDFVRAILTTDRFEKRAQRPLRLGPHEARVVGVAKGAGMIAPNMATTLAFVFTDAAVAPRYLQRLLREEIDRTFNCISVDGDTSTNDSVFLLASGAAGNPPIDGDGDGEPLRAAVAGVLDELSRLIVRDGEGAQHLVTIAVEGAPSDEDARRVARAIAHSPLCKTAFFGADPNWGRILSTVGNCGLTLDHRRIDLAFDDVELVRGAVGLGEAAEARVHEIMSHAEYTIRVRLHAGDGRARHVTCDLGHDYVTLNADYRS